MAKTPKLFRVILQVSDLDKAADFYSKLLNDPGRRIPRASRHYIDCGPVILALVDQSAGGLKARPLPDYIYFAVRDLEEVRQGLVAFTHMQKAKKDVGENHEQWG